MDYAALSLAEVKTGFDAVAADAESTFGRLDARHLNWRPDITGWSVAQCFDHLLAANRLMRRSAEDALDPATARTVWQRLPFIPGALGRMMIRSQAPGTARKFTAPGAAQPASSAVDADVIQRFVVQHRDMRMWLDRVEEPQAASVVMTSPFIRIVTYSVLDGLRLMLAHDRRHFEQALRVMALPDFPT